MQQSCHCCRNYTHTFTQPKKNAHTCIHIHIELRHLIEDKVLVQIDDSINGFANWNFRQEMKISAISFRSMGEILLKRDFCMNNCEIHCLCFGQLKTLWTQSVRPPRTQLLFFFFDSHKLMMTMLSTLSCFIYQNWQTVLYVFRALCARRDFEFSHAKIVNWKLNLLKNKRIEFPSMLPFNLNWTLLSISSLAAYVPWILRCQAFCFVVCTHTPSILPPIP